MKVKFGDVVNKIVGDEDRLTTKLKYYIGGEHIETSRIKVRNRGELDSEKGRTLGYQFHYPFEPGDVLFMTKNPYLKKCGQVDFSGICSIATFVLRTKDENILSQNYLAVITQTDDFWNYLEANKSGSVNYFITWKTLEEYEFELPNLDKQQSLAEIIFASEELRYRYEQQIVATDDLIISQFVEMFGNLGTDEKGWGLTTLGKCCILNPKRPKGIEDDIAVSFVPMPAVTEDGLIDCSNIKPYSEVKKGFTYFSEKDVLFAKITPCMENGKGAVAEGLSNGIGAGSTEFHVLRPIEGLSNPYWLYIITKFNDFRVAARKIMTGTGGQLRVPISFLDEYKIALPPIELQNEFEQFVRQGYKSRSELKLACVHLEMMTRAILNENVG